MKKFYLRGSILISSLAVAYACKTETSTVKSPDQDVATSAPRCNTAPWTGREPLTLSRGPTCEELITKYPSIEDPGTPEDTRVLCPLLRIVNRSKALAQEISNNLAKLKEGEFNLPVSISALVDGVREFGCGKTACGIVAMQVSSGQTGKSLFLTGPKSIVDIGRLDTAKGVAHNCGFTFSLNDTAVNDETRSATLSLLKERADENGRLDHQDIVDTKRDMCQRDFDLAQSSQSPTINKLNADKTSLEPTFADNVEVNLIYAYLGGQENGYILYSDVEKLFHAQMPVNKTKYLLDASLFAHMKLALLAPRSGISSLV